MFGIFNELKFLLRNKVTDPVCKMKVDKKTQYFLEYKGEKYYFCSENCKSQFDASPKEYVRGNTVSNCCQQNTKPCC